MCLFIETLRIVNGVVLHLDYHNERLNRTRAAFFHHASPLNLTDYIHLSFDESFDESVIKCRIVYDSLVREVTYTPYTMRPVGSLHIVESDGIDYRYKHANREALNLLFSQKGEADDILIIRNQLLTDTSIANIALYDGSTWHTPANPLLKGTQRAVLLDKKQLKEVDIQIEQLSGYSHIALFNSMIDFGKIILPVNQIK